MADNKPTYQFTSKIEFITGSKKFRTRAQWPVTIRYTMEAKVVKVTKIFWDKCTDEPGDNMIDVTDFIMSNQIACLEQEIHDLFWKEEKES